MLFLAGRSCCGCGCCSRGWSSFRSLGGRHRLLLNRLRCFNRGRSRSRSFFFFLTASGHYCGQGQTECQRNKLFHVTFTSCVGLNLRTQSARFHAKSSAKYTFFINSVKTIFKKLTIFFSIRRQLPVIKHVKREMQASPFLRSTVETSSGELTPTLSRPLFQHGGSD